MRAATRFSIAVHVLSLLGIDESSQPTSEWMAGSIGVNPVVVRNVTGLLRRAGLVLTQQGVAGTQLARPLGQITLLDVYRAVEEEGPLFAVHSRPNPNCPVGANIEAALQDELSEAQRALESRLARTTMEEIVARLLKSEAS